MKRILATSAMLLAICASSAFGQKAPPAKEKSQNIIIRKNGDDKEKTTIVIDGDKITVNGKPIEDYKGNIEITENSDGNFDFSATPPFPPAAPLAPAGPHGGSKTFVRSFNSMQNSAFLGVASESEDGGASVNSVTKNSPAEKAGLKEGDVITKVGSTHIDDANDLVEAIGKYKPEDKITITYKRDNKENNITVTLEKNKTQTFNWNNSDNVFKNFSLNWNDNKPRLGLRVQDLENNTGVKVIDVNDDDSPAAKAGLHEDDVITQVNGKNVQSVKDVKDQLADVKPGDDVKINYQRGSAAQTATIHIPKPLQTSDL